MGSVLGWGEGSACWPQLVGVRWGECSGSTRYMTINHCPGCGDMGGGGGFIWVIHHGHDGTMTGHLPENGLGQEDIYHNHLCGWIGASWAIGVLICSVNTSNSFLLLLYLSFLSFFTKIQFVHFVAPDNMHWPYTGSKYMGDLGFRCIIEYI